MPSTSPPSACRTARRSQWSKAGGAAQPARRLSSKKCSRALAQSSTRCSVRVATGTITITSISICWSPTCPRDAITAVPNPAGACSPKRTTPTRSPPHPSRRSRSPGLQARTKPASLGEKTRLWTLGNAAAALEAVWSVRENRTRRA